MQIASKYKLLGIFQFLFPLIVLTYGHQRSYSYWTQRAILPLSQVCLLITFPKIGQLWGNPLYNWDYHRQENYKWWISRIRYGLKYTDYLRIDHFRGFEACWAIPFGSPNAINGSWTKGPDKELFKALETVSWQ